MTVDLRVITSDLLPAYQLADSRGFGDTLDREPGDGWTSLELERAIGAFDRGEIVGTGRNYSLDVTLPGGAVLPAAGVSWISVLPTHRRRGILRAMMDRLMLDACAREEPLLMLTASEGGIYGRFGYGVATRAIGVELERRRVAFRDPAPGRVRMVDPVEAEKVAPEVFERVRLTTPAAVSRPEVWWPGEWWDSRTRAARFDVIFEGESGPEGFALYQIEGDWSEGESRKTLWIRDFVAATPAATSALWQYLCGVDLIRTVRAWNLPLDPELPWLLTDPRVMHTTSVRDFLWVRPVDVPALLGSRTYGVDGKLMLEVLDDGPAAGRYALEGGADGATCVRTDAEPDLIMGAAELGCVSLGGSRASLLARAGRIHVSEPGALSRADAMFAAEREPAALTWF